MPLTMPARENRSRIRSRAAQAILSARSGSQRRSRIAVRKDDGITGRHEPPRFPILNCLGVSPRAGGHHGNPCGHRFENRIGHPFLLSGVGDHPGRPQNGRNVPARPGQDDVALESEFPDFRADCRRFPILPADEEKPGCGDRRYYNPCGLNETLVRFILPEIGHVGDRQSAFVKSEVVGERPVSAVRCFPRRSRPL